MQEWKKLILEIFEKKNLKNPLQKILRKSGLKINEFARISEIPESTLYKIFSEEEKDIRLSTVFKIMDGIKRIYGTESPSLKSTIGVITASFVLDQLPNALEVKGKTYYIKEYPALTIEEEIIQGIKAERDGVEAIICGPVAATTLEKIVTVPVISVKFDKEVVMRAVHQAMEKID